MIVWNTKECKMQSTQVSLNAGSLSLKERCDNYAHSQEADYKETGNTFLT
jgi:hypothetical protein